MARSLSGIKVLAQLQADLQNAIDGGTAGCAQGFSYAASVASGTSEDQADLIFADAGRTLSSGSTLDIDLYDLGSLDIGAGSGRDALGQTWAAVEIVAVLIVNRSGNAATFEVGGDGTTAAFNSLFSGDDDVSVGPFGDGGFFYAFNPANPAWAVADTSNHLLRITAAGGVTLTYDIAILARSA